jgi:hypothetical protein
LAAIRETFATNGSLAPKHVYREVAQAAGHARAGRRLRHEIRQAMRIAVRRGIIERNGAEYSLLCRRIDQYTRNHLVRMLLAAMPPGWQTRDEATRAAARHVGYRRTGRNIQRAFKSAINAAIRRGLLDRDGAHLVRKTR